jgi:hypothetical protein
MTTLAWWAAAERSRSGVIRMMSLIAVPALPIGVGIAAAKSRSFHSTFAFTKTYFRYQSSLLQIFQTKNAKIPPFGRSYIEVCVFRDASPFVGYTKAVS